MVDDVDAVGAGVFEVWEFGFCAVAQIATSARKLRETSVSRYDIWTPRGNPVG